jgi:hypothetical protein
MRVLLDEDASAMTALRQAFTFLAGNWRQAAADSTGASLP